MTGTRNVEDPRDALFVRPESEGLARRAGVAARTLVLYSGVRLVLLLATAAVFARLIAPPEHGVFAAALPLVLIAAAFAEFGLEKVMVQRPVMTHMAASVMFATSVVLALALAGIVLLSGGVLAAWYEIPSLDTILWAFVPYILFSACNVQLVAILRRKLLAREVELRDIAANLLAAIVSIGLAIQGAGVYALVLHLVLHQAILAVLLAAHLGWRPSVPRPAEFIRHRDLLSTGVYYAFERLLNTIATSVPLLVLPVHLSSGALAQFFRSESLAVLPQRRLLTPLSGAAIPALSVALGDPAQYRSLFLRFVRATNLILIPASAMLFLAGDAVVWILLGPDWTVAGELLMVLALMPMTASIPFVMAWVLVSAAMARTLLVLRAFYLAVAIPAIAVAASAGLDFAVMTVAVLPLIANGIPALVTAIRSGPLDVGTVFRAFAPELGLAAFTCVAGTMIRSVIEMHILAEAAIMGFFVGAVFLIRVLSSAALRRDVGAVLRFR